jgi:hypothetical protein
LDWWLDAAFQVWVEAATRKHLTPVDHKSGVKPAFQKVVFLLTGGFREDTIEFRMQRLILVG